MGIGSLAFKRSNRETHSNIGEQIVPGSPTTLQRYPFRVARLSICAEAPWPTSDAPPSASAKALSPFRSRTGRIRRAHHARQIIEHLPRTRTRSPTIVSHARRTFRHRRRLSNLSKRKVNSTLQALLFQPTAHSQTNSSRNKFRRFPIVPPLFNVTWKRKEKERLLD